jgi:hypothetical protein
MDESSGLEGVTGTLVSEKAMCQRVEFFVKQRDKGLQGVLVTSTPFNK